MKFYKLSGIGYPVKIHKFSLWAKSANNGIYEKPTSIKSIRNH